MVEMIEAKLPESFKPEDFRTVAEIDAEIARLQNNKKMLWPKTVKLVVSLNQDESSFGEIADDFGFSFDDLQRWEKVCQDLKVTVLVEKDGSAWIVEVGDVPLVRKVAAN